MHIVHLIHQFTDNFQHGTFMFSRGQNLKEVIRTAHVPDLHGVYIILRNRVDDDDSILYIGKSGTINRNGRFKKQGLNKRIANKQNHKPRQQFYGEEMEKLELEYILFTWFVTFDEYYQIIPAKAEGDLMQSYFDTFHCLPPWQKSF